MNTFQIQHHKTAYLPNWSYVCSRKARKPIPNHNKANKQANKDIIKVICCNKVKDYARHYVRIRMQ